MISRWIKKNKIWCLVVAVLLAPFVLQSRNTVIRSMAMISSTIDSTPIGNTSPSTGIFTSLTDNTLTAGNCLQSGTGGLLSTISLPCYAPPNFYSASLSTDQGIPATTIAVISQAAISITTPANGGPWRIQTCYSMSWTTGATPTVDFWVSDGTHAWGKSETTSATSGTLQAGNNACDWSPTTYANNAAVTLNVETEGFNAYTVKAAPLYGGPNSGMKAIVFPSN